MIMPTRKDNLGGNAPMQNFNIELNSTMFDMVSAKVYTDTIMAGIREYSTNAVDACIAAGLKPKFKVHIPTMLEPHFSVRDYGTGLSDEDIKGLFSTIGASTKRNSNDFNGVFGIGKMAALAYGTEFTVSSYFNGAKISYVVTTQQGLPKMVSMGSVKTDEHNGLEISYEVKQKDIDTFVDRCEKVYRYFDHKPITNVELDYKPERIVISGSDWRLEESSGYSYGHRDYALAITGNVAYKIDASPFNDASISRLLESNMRFDVPLGAVSINPGRESLSLDEGSIAYLTNRFKAAQKEALQAIENTVATLPTEWDRMVAYEKALKEAPYGLINSASYVPTLPYIEAVSNYRGATLRLGKFDKLPDNVSIALYESHRTTPKIITNSNSNVNEYVNVGEDIYFMEADIRTNIQDAVIAYRATLTGRKTIIVVKTFAWNKDKLSAQKAERAVVFKDFGDPKVVKASDYYTPTNAISTKGSTVITAKDFCLVDILTNGTTSVYTRKGRMLSSQKGVKKFYYVEVSGFEIINMKLDKISAYLRFAEILRDQNPNIEKFTICGVTKGGMKNIAKDTRFEPIENLKKYEGSVSFIDHTATREYKRYFERYHSTQFKLFMQNCPDAELKRNLELVEAFNEIHPYDRWATKTEGISDILACKTVRPKTTMSTDDITARYPLLPMLLDDGYRNPASAEDLIYYINLEGK